MVLWRANALPAAARGCPCSRRRERLRDSAVEPVRFGFGGWHLVVGVGGGYYLGQDRRVQEQGIDARFAAELEQAENALLKEHHLDHESAMACATRSRRSPAARQEAAKAAAARANQARGQPQEARSGEGAGQGQALRWSDPGLVHRVLRQPQGRLRADDRGGFEIDQSRAWTSSGPGKPLERQRAQRQFRRARHPQASREQDGYGGRRLADQPGDADQWGLGYIEGRSTPLRRLGALEDAGRY